MTTKVCATCNEEKDIQDFPVRQKNNKKRRIEKCMTCYNAYFRLYNKNNKAHQKRVNKVRKEKSDFVSNIKLTNGCFICGYKKCKTSLHFHHLHPEDKRFNISWAVRKNLSKDNINTEIDKCVILCSNCHGEIEEGVIEL